MLLILYKKPLQIGHCRENSERKLKHGSGHHLFPLQLKRRITGYTFKPVVAVIKELIPEIPEHGI